MASESPFSQASIRGFACPGSRPGNPVTRSDSQTQAHRASDEEVNIESESFLRRVRAHALTRSLTPIRLIQILYAPAALPPLIKTKNNVARA